MYLKVNPDKTNLALFTINHQIPEVRGANSTISKETKYFSRGEIISVEKIRFLFKPISPHT